jgi:hypothetical protein
VNGQLARIDLVLARIERLAEALHPDPDRHLLRSANELRTAFRGRQAIEPAVARMRDGLDMLRRANRAGVRGAFKRGAHGLDHLERVVEQELLPELRRIGFEV